MLSKLLLKQSVSFNHIKKPYILSNKITHNNGDGSQIHRSYISNLLVNKPLNSSKENDNKQMFNFSEYNINSDWENNLTKHAEINLKRKKNINLIKCLIPFYPKPIVSIDNIFFWKLNRVIYTIKTDMNNKEKLNQKSMLEYYYPKLEYLKSVSEPRQHRPYYRYHKNIMTSDIIKAFIGLTTFIGCYYIYPITVYSSLPFVIGYSGFSMLRAIGWTQEEEHYNEQVENFCSAI